MAENVYSTAAIGRQAGTFAAPGASVAATELLMVTEVPNIELDRASGYPTTFFGRNAMAHASTGRHGIRGASLPLNGELSFEQIMHVLEMHYAGGVTPSGAGPYTWVYPLEGGAPSLVPYTVESGSEASQDQWEAVGVLIDELTLGFDDLDAPGIHPWTFEGSALAINRVAAALTSSLTTPASMETMQGHLTVLKEGTTATAFASLAELSASLVSFQLVTRRALVLRVYGGTSETATGYGFSEKTSGEVTAKIRIGASSKTNIHDIWNVAGGALTERRWRITVDGAGDNVANLDLRLGFTALPIGERDGERVYEVTGQIVDDSTLGAPAQWTIVNGRDDLVL